MGKPKFSRRGFITSLPAGISAAWMAANWPEIAAAQQHAHQAAASSDPAAFGALSPAEAREIEAMAAQIVPSDETPGAREAGVVYFIDRALQTFARDRRKEYADGLKQLESAVRKRNARVRRFSDLSGEQQIEVLRSIENTNFFELVRTHTVMGFMSNPQYGGNRGKAGWKLIGFEDDFMFLPPFGYYDRNAGGNQ